MVEQSERISNAGVEAFAGAVGGVATTGVPGDCSTYGAPEPEASFYWRNA